MSTEIEVSVNHLPVDPNREVRQSLVYMYHDQREFLAQLAQENDSSLTSIFRSILDAFISAAKESSEGGLVTLKIDALEREARRLEKYVENLRDGKEYEQEITKLQEQLTATSEALEREKSAHLETVNLFRDIDKATYYERLNVHCDGNYAEVGRLAGVSREYVRQLLGNQSEQEQVAETA